MSQIKISNLTTYTGSTSDVRWFIMNNGGNTETFKFSGYPAQLIAGTGTDSYRTPNAVASNNSSIAIGNLANCAGNLSIAVGDDAQANGVLSLAIGYKTRANVGNGQVCIGWDSSAGDSSVIIGGSNIGTGQESTIVGYNSEVTRNKSNLIGTISQITNGDYQNILGSYDSRITSSNNYNNIIGGEGNTISGTTSGTTLIGLRNYVQPTLNDLTYSNNYHALRTYSTKVQTLTSGVTFTFDLNEGGKGQFALTGASTIDITNVRDGQSFMVKTQTNGNYTITWTATGYTFEFEGGIKDPGNTTTDIFVFEVFGTTIYGNRRHNYS